ncbi:MAG: hypothetical protein AAFQ17_01850, partial [Pseudomonadota bacterium]
PELVVLTDRLARQLDDATDRSRGDDHTRVVAETVRENKEIWVLSSSDTLRVLPVSVEWRNESTVVASAEFELGDRVITSFLSDPVPGQALRARENQ